LAPRPPCAQPECQRTAQHFQPANYCRFRRSPLSSRSLGAPSCAAATVQG
jgi:hypothetical protein